MKPIRMTRAASRDLSEALKFYENGEPAMDLVFLTEYEKALDRIRQYPSGWAWLESGKRRCQLHIFPYAIIYKELETEISVIAIMHMHRDPEFWRSR